MTQQGSIPLSEDVAASNSVLPVGMLVATAATVEPIGWLFCDGRLVSRATYATLFTALGGNSSPYGTGDGSTTFNLPDLRGRVPVGADNYGAGAAGRLPNSNRARGQVGGEERHLLTASESGVAAHAHTASSGVTDPGHVHNFGGASVVTKGAGADFNEPNVAGNRQDITQTGAASTGITVATTVNAASAASASAAHNVLQPYQVAGAWLIKT